VRKWDRMNLVYVCVDVHQEQHSATVLDNFNHHRYQWDRKKMASVEYRNHLLAGSDSDPFRVSTMWGSVHNRVVFF
jgi:hypothetical protein